MAMAIPITAFTHGNCHLDTVAIQILYNADSTRWARITDKFQFLKTVVPSDYRSVFDSVQQAYPRIEADILASISRFSSEWSNYEASWYLFLSELFECGFPNETVFSAGVGIANISPRSIATKEFIIPYYAPPSIASIVIAHETSHFFYYKSITNSSATQTHPYLDWIISEALVPIIFSLPEVKSLFPFPLPSTSYAVSEKLIDTIEHEMSPTRTSISWLKKREAILVHVRSLITEYQMGSSNVRN
ncbi:MULTISPECIES: hypothetical protein [unclassified Agarivorans]|uniref:hypothetical protein n=1 Tax=unclassified Agarivorans TaxID=2636026 RepID=UPI0026E3974F|nr:MULTISPECIES: hypothetical protein [unclassified Agarivorans]MDO6684602.1 hypothetical protein [Agarivorans sp. 3_MG-2023]MDO6714767.1 hypothetical protein [Agarivorans sp. 2_MG-2023]